jgi:hypothetical protein
LSGLIDHFIAVTSDLRNHVVCSTGDFRGYMDLSLFPNTPVVLSEYASGAFRIRQWCFPNTPVVPGF